ncbi:acyl-CoA dehydrogenase [Serratia plymuthica]|uniref:Acyl-CoA dehydrogenase n=1 Tax=Serratia plymuthica S13 TaxID=1348660 RepID=S4YV56_SERPL|nr:acyl-CoA dehydrogenase [Serratia plymuthica]AGP46748.1 acyl-CoA dehydrogenase [Serratia plymuthica S13]ANJ93028.1 acyl-CoA dehydrogenase [Serratia plymuthica]ANJ96909.1 acyl-CoA dehydrogenase [Serratia plymuthica]EKF66482.1 acyl-CoA dehydrogenase [Serratia plymuthica A30]KYG18098.1 Acryloyl-CoA reductase [Serratia plymuthica]
MNAEHLLTVDMLERQLTPAGCDGYAAWTNAVLTADAACALWAEGEARLDEAGFNRCLIPQAMGGQWRGLDALMDLFRVLYRKDPCLGLGYAGSSFIACCNIWAVGSPTQQRTVAQALHRNEKVACSYYEPEHGNDLSAVEFSADRQDGRWVLEGEKQVTSNIARSSVFVAFARTSPQPGSRSHTQILIVKSQLPDGALQELPRHSSVGMRGVQLGGVRFDRTRLPAAADDELLLGAEGKALETTLRSFQVTRTLLPGMFVGVLDSGLRLATRFSLQRQLYGHRLADFPSARQVLSLALLDLLLADAFSRLGARALHVHPEFCCLYAPSIKIVVPKLLIGAMNRLADHLGASFYLTESEFGLFQKLLRDIKPAGFAHVGRPACQLTLLPLLFMLARKNAATPEAARLSPTLASDAPIDEPIDFNRLQVAPTGRDPLLDSLLHTAPLLGAVLATQVLAARERLLDKLQTLDPRDISATAPAGHYQLSTLYAGLLAIAACLQWHQTAAEKLPLALTQLMVKRQLVHLQIAPDEGLDESEADYVCQRLFDDYRRRVSFDLMQYPLQGWEE